MPRARVPPIFFNLLHDLLNTEMVMRLEVFSIPSFPKVSGMEVISFRWYIKVI